MRISTNFILLYIFDICFPKGISYVKDDSHVKWLTEETVQSHEQLKELYRRTRNFPDNNVKLYYVNAKRQHASLLSNTQKNSSTNLE